MFTVLGRTAQSVLLGCLIWLGFSAVCVAPAQAQKQEQAPAIKAITGGFGHTCILTAAGDVRCWGDNDKGQLGDGTTNASMLPVEAVGLGGGVQAIAAGWELTCALTAEGRVLCWGQTSGPPAEVPGLGSGIQAIAVGYEHACAVTAGGGVKCWGSNYSGELGNGAFDASLAAVDVVGLQSGVQTVAAGGAHSCAVTVGGGVQCWGRNYSGQLGNGTTVNSTTPVAVAGLDSGAQKVVAGEAHTCALLAGGAVKCWGDNRDWQVAGSDTEVYLEPVTVAGLSSVRDIVSGGAHLCALAAGDAGDVLCWGRNYNGELGIGAITGRSTPQPVSELGGEATAIGSGRTHTCALLADGGARCWGDNWAGQLGGGFTWRRAQPAPVAGLEGPVQAIAAGDGHTCVLTGAEEGQAGGVLCWGVGDALGDGKTDSRFRPAPVSGLESGVRAIAAGRSHTCALTSSGGVQCWGQGWAGQLGDGSLEWSRLTPVPVAGLQSGVQAIAAGRGHSCAVLTSGGVRCWGDNKGGQLGDGAQISSPKPVDVVGLAGRTKAVAAGLGITCALAEDGAVQCWGATRVGDGTRELRSAPVAVAGLSSGVQAITAGNWHACALTTAGAVQCWGDNQYGQLGDGSTDERLVPVAVLGLDRGVQSITAGGDATCAVLVDGGLRCWGWNHSNMYAGETKPSPTPAAVFGIDGQPQRVALGGEYTCVLATAAAKGGRVQCWGFNIVGQLGVNPGWAPVDVLALLPRALFAPVVRQ